MLYTTKIIQTKVVQIMRSKYIIFDDTIAPKCVDAYFYLMIVARENLTHCGALFPYQHYGIFF